MDTTTKSYNPGDVVTLTYAWGEERPYVIPAYATAVMIDPADGSIADIALNWETSESMVLEGYVAIPIGPINRKQYSKRFANLRELWLDCWT